MTISSFAVRSLCCLSLMALGLMAFQPTSFADDKKSKKEDVTEAPPYTGPKKRLIVAYSAPPVNQADRNALFYNAEYLRTLKQLNGNINTIDDVGLKLTEMLTTALVNTNRFVVLERQDIGDIKDEIKIGEELGNEKTRVKKGNVLGAQLIVRCAVTEFAPNKSSKGAFGNLGSRIGLGGGEKVSTVTVDVKMFDANTSQLIASKSASGDSKTKAQAGGVRIGSLGVGFGKSESDPIEKATRSAIERAVEVIIAQMEKMPWEGRVALVDKNDEGVDEYTINRGENDGLKVGDMLQVFRAGKEVIDPDTGEVLDRSEDKLLGDCKVVYVNKRTCRIECVNKFAVAKGDVVKLAPSK